MSRSIRSLMTRVLGTLVAGVLVSAPGLAAQTGSITGQVTDAQTGVSVMAAQVYIASLNRGGLSQQNGRYLLQNVPAGRYTMTVARIGYQMTDVQITVGGGQTLDQDFSVAEEALPLNGVIVQGRMPSQGVRRPGRFVEAMEELERVTESFQPFELRVIRAR